MSTPSVKPSPTTWTLLLKHDRQTILLHVPPDLPFPRIKSLLLSALSSSTSALSPRVSSNTSAESILFAAPLDQSDLSQGFTSLEPSDMAHSDNDEYNDMDTSSLVDDSSTAKGKGKTNKGKGKAKQGVATDCPKGAGLSDGAVIAFRLADEEEWRVDVPVFEEWEGEQRGMDDDEDGAGAEVDEGMDTEEDEIEVPVPGNAVR